jgi:hypothetical protein
VADQGGYEGGFESNGSGGEAGGGASLDKLAASFEKFQADTFARLDALAQQEPDDDFDPRNPLEADLGDFEPDQIELNERGQLAMLEAAIRRHALAQVSESRNAEQNARRAHEADALEARYPDLAGEDQDGWIAVAIERANAFGRPDLAREPAWVEQVYLAEKARTLGADEIPAGSETEVVLERSGAAGGGGSQGDDTEDRMLASWARGKHRVHRVESSR